jgi:virulence-associated protein VapD
MSSKSMGKLAFCKLNLVDLFTKLLPLAIFDKCVKDIGMKRLKDLQDLGGTPIKVS